MESSPNGSISIPHGRDLPQDQDTTELKVTPLAMHSEQSVHLPVESSCQPLLIALIRQLANVVPM